MRLAVALSDGRELDLRHLPEALQDGLRGHGRPGAPVGMPAAPSASAPLRPIATDPVAPIPAAPPSAKPKPYGAAPTEAELREILAKHKGNIAAVGRELGKERMQVHRWLKRYAIDIGDYR